MSNFTEYDALLDARGLVCPMPLLKTRLELHQLKAGETLLVIASDSGSWRDIPKYLAHSEHALLDSQENADSYFFLIRKAAN